MAKRIKGTYPAILSNEREYETLLRHKNLQCLKDRQGNEIHGFASLTDDQEYTGGPPIKEPNWIEYAFDNTKNAVARVILPQQRRAAGTCFLLSIREVLQQHRQHQRRHQQHQKQQRQGEEREEQEGKWFLSTHQRVVGEEIACQIKFRWSAEKFDAKVEFADRTMGLAVLSIKTPPIPPRVQVQELVDISREISKGSPLALVGFRDNKEEGEAEEEEGKQRGLGGRKEEEDEATIRSGVLLGFVSAYHPLCLQTSVIANDFDCGGPIVGYGELLGVAAVITPAPHPSPALPLHNASSLPPPFPSPSPFPNAPSPPPSSPVSFPSAPALPTTEDTDPDDTAPSPPTNKNSNANALLDEPFVEQQEEADMIPVIVVEHFLELWAVKTREKNESGVH